MKKDIDDRFWLDSDIYHLKILPQFSFNFHRQVGGIEIG